MITASIVVFNTEKRELIKVLKCALDSIIEIVYIVDNSPSDKLKTVANISPKIEYIFGHGNVGYGAGHNIAIRHSIDSNSKYHVILNPDVYFNQSTIKTLSKFMDINNDVGLVMPKILYPSGKIQYLCKLLPTPFDLIYRRFSPLRKKVEERNVTYELRFANYDQSMEVPSLSGCFMFICTNILKEIGGFDERFFMYAEDVDLCRRIGQKSKTLYLPEATAIHNYEKGSYRSKKLLFYHIKSIIKYFNKWGWFFDKERKKINKITLQQLQESHQPTTLIAHQQEEVAVTE